MPDETTADPPKKSRFERLGPALPVGLAAIATAFAGMSSSEMARAMFWRSAAAQDQAKATSQWTLSGFKKDRALVCTAAAATLRATNGAPLPEKFGDDESSEAARWLRGQGPPDFRLPAPADPRIAEVRDGIERKLPEDELVALAAGVSMSSINDAINTAETANDRNDQEWEAVLREADRIARGVSPVVVGQAARFELDARRYQREVRLNQQLSLLYEVRVRVTTAESERHRKRSGNFFYAMLVGQVGATGSSLALGRQRRSALWTIAGISGLVAVGFGGSVYATM
jgi:hypothetical protein